MSPPAEKPPNSALRRAGPSRLVGAAYRHRQHRRVIAPGRQRRRELAHHGQRQRIERLGPVQRDEADLAAHLGQHLAGRFGVVSGHALCLHPISSLATSAPMTSKPPLSTLAAGTSPAPDPGQQDAENDLQQRQQRDFGRLQHAGADHRQHAGNRQLHQAQQGQQAQVTPASRQTETPAAAWSARKSPHPPARPAPGRFFRHAPGCAAPRSSSPPLRWAPAGPPACRQTGATPPPRLTWLPYIQAMPTPATAIATQVRGAIRWPMKMRAASAVRKGPSASVTSTLATVVMVSASMKAVNMMLQHTPGDPQEAAGMADAREHRAALEHRQDHQQRQQGEKAAPEGHLETARRLQVARHHPGDRPHQRDRDHQEDGSGMREFHD